MIDLSTLYLLTFLVLAVRWVVMLVALVVINVIVARGALAKAHEKDIPAVLVGLAAVIGALPGLGPTWELRKKPTRHKSATGSGRLNLACRQGDRRGAQDEDATSEEAR